MTKPSVQTVSKVALNPRLLSNPSEWNFTNITFDVDVIGRGIPTPQCFSNRRGTPSITSYTAT